MASGIGSGPVRMGRVETLQVSCVAADRAVGHGSFFGESRRRTHPKWGQKDYPSGVQGDQLMRRARRISEIVLLRGARVRCGSLLLLGARVWYAEGGFSSLPICRGA